jgi:hypothetical protein
MLERIRPEILEVSGQLEQAYSRGQDQLAWSLWWLLHDLGYIASGGGALNAAPREKEGTHENPTR